jgi:hypothetical protein
MNFRQEAEKYINDFKKSQNTITDIKILLISCEHQKIICSCKIPDYTRNNTTVSKFLQFFKSKETNEFIYTYINDKDVNNLLLEKNMLKKIQCRKINSSEKYKNIIKIHALKTNTSSVTFIFDNDKVEFPAGSLVRGSVYDLSPDCMIFDSLDNEFMAYFEKEIIDAN